MPPLIDKDVIAGCKRGDEEAFKTLLRRTGGWLRSELIGWCGDPRLADEIASDVYYLLMTPPKNPRPGTAPPPGRNLLPKGCRIDAFKYPGQLIKWLRTAAKRCWQARRRYHHRHPFLTAELEAELDVDPAPDPLEEAERKERVHIWVAELPTRQRQVVELRWFQGLTYPLIAEQLGIAVGTAAWYAFDALQTLRDWYAGEDETLTGWVAAEQPAADECDPPG